MISKTKIFLAAAFLIPILSMGEDEARSARNFAAVVEAIADHDDAIAEALSEVASAAGEVENITQQITSKRQEAQKLQQEAQEAFNQANMLNNLAANQGAGGGGGGGGGSGGGAGGGSKGLQLKAPELPEMPEAASFEMPSAPPGVDLGDVASSLSFNGRGATSSPMENTFPNFTNFNLPANPQATSPKMVSPGAVAAGNLPQLSGNKTAGTPIGPSQSTGGMPGGAGGGGGTPGGGMMGGGMGGGMMGGGPDAGGDVMATVGAEPYFAEGGLRVQTQQMGESGGDGSGAGAGDSVGGGPDESAVKAQISRGVARGTASKDKNLNPEGKGLMAYVGFIESACRKAEKTLEVCKGPMVGAEKAKLAALPKVEVLSEPMASPVRSIASPPSQENYGPVRAGLLGLVSGK